MGYTIHYFQDGEGPCAGPPAPAPAPEPEASVEAPAPSPAAEAEVAELAEEEEAQPVLYMRTFGAWVGGLNIDDWGLASFIMAIFAGEPACPPACLLPCLPACGCHLWCPGAHCMVD